MSKKTATVPGGAYNYMSITFYRQKSTVSLSYITYLSLPKQTSKAGDVRTRNNITRYNLLVERSCLRRRDSLGRKPKTCRRALLQEAILTSQLSWFHHTEPISVLVLH